jgi:hypothetical protein
MKYFSGEEVQEGDEVQMWRDGSYLPGVVIEIVAPGSPAAETWSAPEGGVVIEGCGLGLSITTSLENDSELVLVRRRQSVP